MAHPARLRFGVVCMALLSAVSLAEVRAQMQPPSPSPTNPNPPTITNGPGQSMVVNPTTEECRRGWTSGTAWTKEQFEKFCTQLQTSK